MQGDGKVSAFTVFASLFRKLRPPRFRRSSMLRKKIQEHAGRRGTNGQGPPGGLGF